MTGHGASHGAGTVVNAMATGRGAAFGLDFHVAATVETADDYVVQTQGHRLKPKAAALALECVRLVEQAAGKTEPVLVTVDSDIPPARGLKSSSAVAIATLRAACEHHDVEPDDDEEILGWAAEAGLRSGTSVTGAYDDAAACLLGGLVLTDNRERRLLERRPMPDGLVALVRIPERENPTSEFRRANLEAARPGAEEAFRMVEGGDVPGAMKANTKAYAALFDVDVSFVDEARAAGAWAAGISGTGPALIALVEGAHADDFAGLGADRKVALFGGDAE